MPNWCDNTVEISHTDPAMIERVRKAFNEGKFLSEFIPCPEDLNITASPGTQDEELQALYKINVQKHGYPNWYEWQIANWGTKWDVGADGYEAEDKPGGLTLCFQSAWSPPCNAYQRLVDEFGFSIRAYYHEPGMCYAGIWEDGDDDYYEWNDMSSAEAEEMLPEALNEMYGISEYLAECESQEEDCE